MSVSLVSSDNEERTVSNNAIRRSKYLVQAAEANQGKPLKLEVNTKVLEIVVDYLNHYEKQDPQPVPQVLKTNDLRNEIKNEFDVNLVSTPNFETIFHLINAAATLELEHLHDLACARVAAFMKDKSPINLRRSKRIRIRSWRRWRCIKYEMNYLNENF
jgi:hypothetical protein